MNLSSHMTKPDGSRSRRTGTPKHGISHRSGAMLVLFLITLPVILAFAVMSVNIAWMQLTRTELRTATDAACRAGSRTLSMLQDVDAARSAAVEGAKFNDVAGAPLLLATGDLQFGLTQPRPAGLWPFTERDPDVDSVNSVRVTGRRVAGSPSGPVPLLFAGLFSRTTFEPVKVATATQIDRDIVLVLDRSGSMKVRTPTGRRWTDLTSAVDVFLSTLEETFQEEQVGLVTYAKDVSTDAALTDDYEQIRQLIAATNPGGGTGIGAGIEAGRLLLTDSDDARDYAEKTIVVMTDGKHKVGIDPADAAAAASLDYGITVHTITFSSEANEEEMRRTAEAGGGYHWHADDQESLAVVFEEVANSLPTLITE